MTSRKEDKAREQSNQGPRESDLGIEDLEKYLDPLIGEFSNFLSMLLGRRINLNFTSGENRMKILNALKEMARKSKQIERIKESDMPAEEKLVGVVDLWDSMYRNMAPGMTEGQHFIDWNVAMLEAVTKGPTNDLFFAATRYSEHVQTIDRLLQECASGGRYRDVRDFLEDARKGETAFSSSQALFARLMPAYGFLHEVFPITRTHISFGVSSPTHQLIAKDSISREDIDKGLRYYGDFASEFEKRVRIIVGLLEILGTGTRPDYGKIKGQDLSVNLRKVEESGRYRGLVAPFSRTIRNALAHGDHMIDPIREEVSFSDRRGDATTMSFAEFFRKLADLSGLVLALLSLQNCLILLGLRQARDAYHQAKKEH